MLIIFKTDLNSSNNFILIQAIFQIIKTEVALFRIILLIIIYGFLSYIEAKTINFKNRINQKLFGMGKI